MVIKKKKDTEEKLIIKGHKEMFRDDEHVHYLDCGGKCLTGV